MSKNRQKLHIILGNGKVLYMKKLVFTLFALITISCGNSTKSDENKIDISSKESTKETPDFKILHTWDYDISSLEYDGNIVNRKAWQDSNGKNIVLFTQKKEELFAYHYVIRSKDVKLMRRVYDFAERNCEYDLFAEFIERSIKVTDINNNNLGEITFAYKLACISDVSPLTLKLLILENGNKYIIRGTTKVDLGSDYIIESTKKIDPSFKKASKSFTAHAKKIWKDIEKG